MDKNRKVGGVIIMHDNHNNYGTSLQGFATVKTIKKIGYQLRIIRYIKHRKFLDIIKMIPFFLLNGGLRVLFNNLVKKINTRTRPDYMKKLQIRTSVVNKFKKQYFDSISDYYIGYDALCEGANKYDIIFVGSDQVWGPLSLCSKFYNLLFVNKNIPKFSYASSFGVSNIPRRQINGTKEYLDQLDAVGVREIRGKEIVDLLSKNEAKVVADPTMLLSREEWEEHISVSNMEIEEPYILSYVLGERKDIREEVNELKRKTGFKIVSFPHIDWYEKNDDGFGDVQIWDADPLDFLKLLSNAEYVCTDSFHGTIFSIIFQKKFLTFYRQDPKKSNSTHSRIDSILKLFNVQSRLFNGGEIYEQIVQDIDYRDVEERLSNYRMESIEFLKECLTKEK